MLQGALQTGLMEADWEINKVLHSINHLQGEIYIKELGCDIFLLHFCKTRWVEDEPIAARGIQIWESIVQVVNYWLSLSKSKRPRNNKSFDTLVRYHTDKLMVSKFHFLKYIASIMRPFLLQSQTSKPTIPFLAIVLHVTLRQLISLVVKIKFVFNENTPSLLLQLVLGKNKNHPDLDKVELGSAVTSVLANLKVKEKDK